MRNYFTPDGIIALCILVSIILCTVLWILIKARQNDGVAEIPSQLLFGWDGAAWGPNIIVISKDYWNKKPLIAHERCHQAQQRRDGLFTFWWRYTASTTRLRSTAYILRNRTNSCYWRLRFYRYKLTDDICYKQKNSIITPGVIQGLL